MDNKAQSPLGPGPVTPDGSSKPKKVRMKRALYVPVGIAAGAGLLIGGLVGGLIGASPLSDLEQQIATQQASISTLSEQNSALLSDAEGHAAAIQEQQELAAEAKTNAETTIAEYKDAQKATEGKLKERETAVAAAEKQLAQDQKEFDGAVADREANTIGPGLYEVGVDVKAGKYKTSGPDGANPVGCYYAWLSSSESDADILDNNIVNGQAVVTLRKGQFFEVKACEDFVKQ
ncbi:hypothetical protein [Arthrobacter sp. JSM 101049]|uniref:hypothetical protein n=1 Tax=Arthrobacter sp. JSM 101049 TaxID=929097 RepID=UPI00356A83DE